MTDVMLITAHFIKMPIPSYIFQNVKTAIEAFKQSCPHLYMCQHMVLCMHTLGEEASSTRSTEHLSC